MKIFKYIISLFILVSLNCCKEQTNNIEITQDEYHHALDKLTQVMVRDIFSPPVASRIYVYPNIAAYEVLSENNKKFNSLSGQLNQLNIIKPTEPNKDINFNLASLIAYIDIAKDLVFSKEIIESYRDSLSTIWSERNLKEFKASQAYGLSISSQIREWMASDNYANTRTMPEYNFRNKSKSHWIPTPPTYMAGIEPNWNKMRPFILDSAAQFKPKPHPTFSLDTDSQFFKELLEVYETVNRIREIGDDSEEIQIARFWDCNPYVTVLKGHYMFAEKKITPGAHWIGICKIASQQTSLDFEHTVYAHTKTAIAIADAFISCWDEKYRSNLIRPETLINMEIDEKWMPILQTPPFPEYTSGHSVVSNAAAEVLSEIFGENFYFEDTTEIPFGLPIRSFNSFKQAAKEAAISRVYAGIHYKSAVVEGEKQGIIIGKHVNNTLTFLNEY